MPSQSEDFLFEDDDQVPQENGTSPFVWFLFLAGLFALGFVFRKQIARQVGGGAPAGRGRYQRVGGLRQAE